MAITINQITAASYNDVLNEARKPSNQWAESAAMREFERQGIVVTVPGGPVFESTLDYKRNAGAAFQATDMSSVSTNKTEVLTAAQFDPAELSVPITWSRGDEAKNPSVNQKVALVKSLITNALTSHDDMIEEAIFAANTLGFLGLPTIVPNTAGGNVGGIDSAVEVWWRAYAGTFAAAFTDIEAKATLAWNTITKGSGSSQTPTLLISNAATHAGFEGTQVTLQRFVDTQDAKMGFKTLAFKTARYIFSQYASAHIYFLSKALQIKVVKGAFRDLGEMEPLPAQNAFQRKIYTMLQTTTNNRSRLGVIVST